MFKQEQALFKKGYEQLAGHTDRSVLVEEGKIGVKRGYWGHYKVLVYHRGKYYTLWVNRE